MKRRAPDNDLPQSSEPARKKTKIDTQAIYSRTLNKLMGGAREMARKPSRGDPIESARAEVTSEFPDTGTCHVCRQPANLATCGYCNKKACRACTTTCDMCSGLFCSFCSNPNYDDKYSKTFCVTCTTMKQNSTRSETSQHTNEKPT